MEMMIVCLRSLNGKAVNHCPSGPLTVPVAGHSHGLNPGKIFQIPSSVAQVSLKSKSLIGMHEAFFLLFFFARQEKVNAAFSSEENLPAAHLSAFYKVSSQRKVGPLGIRRLPKERNAASVRPPGLHLDLKTF